MKPAFRAPTKTAPFRHYFAIMLSFRIRQKMHIILFFKTGTILLNNLNTPILAIILFFKKKQNFAHNPDFQHGNSFELIQLAQKPPPGLANGRRSRDWDPPREPSGLRSSPPRLGSENEGLHHGSVNEGPHHVSVNEAGFLASEMNTRESREWGRGAQQKAPSQR